MTRGARLFAAALLCAAPLFPGNRARLVILHTNDLHAKIDRLPAIARLVDEERRRSPHVLLLSAGDSFTGNAVVDQFRPKGEPLLQLMNRMGYDAAQLGNHEFDYGQETLASFAKRARFPMLGANIRTVSSPLPQPRPYVILRRGGLRIAVLGLLQVEPGSGIPSSSPEKLRGIEFDEPLQVAARFRWLRSQCDLFIALSHLGADMDEKLAALMPELDLIVGGHTHTVIDKPELIHNVLIAQAGADGRFLGRIEVELENRRVVSRRGELRRIEKDAPENRKLRRLVDRYNRNPALARVVGRLRRPLEGKGPLGSLICDALRAGLGLDVVFQNDGGIRRHSLFDPIRLRDLYEMCPFANDIIEYRMSAAEIRSLVGNAWARNRELDLQVSGLSYTVRTGPQRQLLEVRLFDPDGRPLDETRTYRVGFNSYIATAYRFDHADPGRALNQSDVELIDRYIGGGADLDRYVGLERIREETVAEN